MSDHENYRNEIKAYIVRAGMTMSEVVEVLADEYGWSSSYPPLQPQHFNINQKKDTAAR